MDPSQIDFSNTKAMLVTILAAVVAAVARTVIKDYREGKERQQKILQDCARQAYNSVQNRLKKGDVIEDKATAGLEALDRFLVLRRGNKASTDEKEQARLVFDAIHGEYCPGGTGSPADSGTPQ